MSDDTHIYPVPSELANSAWIDNDKYLAMYEKSVDDPDGFYDSGESCKSSIVV